MRQFIKKITHPFLKFGLKLYYFKPRKYCYEQICVTVHPDVFPPHLTLSTKILLDFFRAMNLQQKSFLELGCGSGIISLYAASKGAIATATDINERALSFLRQNATKNKLELRILYSNLFQNIQNEHFDFICINPPYYPRQAKNIKEQAWFCGEHFEYFEALFQQIGLYLNASNQSFMILSEDCKIDTIKTIALKNNISLYCVAEKVVLKEHNYIYKMNKA